MNDTVSQVSDSLLSIMTKSQLLDNRNNALDCVQHWIDRVCEKDGDLGQNREFFVQFLSATLQVLTTCGNDDTIFFIFRLLGQVVCLSESQTFTKMILDDM